MAAEDFFVVVLLPVFFYAAASDLHFNFRVKHVVKDFSCKKRRNQLDEGDGWASGSLSHGSPLWEERHEVAELPEWLRFGIYS